VIYIDCFGNICKKTTGHAGAQFRVSQDQMAVLGFAPHRLNAITNPNGACDRVGFLPWQKEFCRDIGKSGKKLAETDNNLTLFAIFP